MLWYILSVMKVCQKVYLDIGALGHHELLVDETAVLAQVIHVWIELRAAVVHFAEQALAASTGAHGIVNVYVVILRVDGLLDQRLVDLHTVHHNILRNKIKML